MSAEREDTERTTVATYVPAYQKAEWKDHADRLGMTQSEFVRTMVQAGRHEFGVPDGSEPDDPGRNPRDERPEDASPERERFERRLTRVLSGEEYLSWDELIAALTDDIESRLDETLQRLQSAGAVRYSGRHGGYTLAEGRDDE